MLSLHKIMTTLPKYHQQGDAKPSERTGRLFVIAAPPNSCPDGDAPPVFDAPLAGRRD